MSDSRTIIIGDIHGCFDELQELLKKTSFRRGVDRLISVGDVINKGPYSLKCLEALKSIGAEVVLGNHELGFLHFCKGQWAGNESFQKLMNEMGEQLGDWVSYISGFPKYIEAKNFIVVHAGLIPNEDPEFSDMQFLATIRTWDGQGKNLQSEENPAWFEFYKGSKLVVFGHWAKRGLVLRENVVGLDTGCVYGKELSALILPERQLVQVPAKQSYSLIKS